MRLNPSCLERAFATDDPDQYHDDRQYQEHVYESAERIRGHKTKTPQDEKHYRNC